MGHVRFVCTLMLTLAAITHAVTASAQPFKAGDRLEYRAERFPEKWEVGVFLKMLPGDTQALIRQKPTQFFPEGFERAYALEDIRPLTSSAPTRPVPAPPAPPPPARPAAPATAARVGGAGPMSQDDVLSFLRARLGDGDPFMNPKREQALQALREEILLRGVSFRHTAIGPFSDALSRFGALSNVTAPLSLNFGPPAVLSALLGKWRLLKVGATTTVTRGGQLYQRQEYAGDAGSITINADGTYLWVSPSGPISNRWRKASDAEMAKSDMGGEGVVLLQAKSGADWIAFARDEGGPEGKGIKLADLATRNLRERGTR